MKVVKVQRLLVEYLGRDAIVKKVRDPRGRRRYGLLVDRDRWTTQSQAILRTIECVERNFNIIDSSEPRAQLSKTVEAIDGQAMKILMITKNVDVLRTKRVYLYTVLDREKYDMVGIQETLLSNPKCRPWIPDYMTIKAKMINEDGSRGIELAVGREWASC